MELFPRQIRALATSKGTLRADGDSKSTSIKLFDEGDILETIHSKSSRAKFLLILARIATAGSGSSSLKDDLTKLANEPSSSRDAASMEEVSFLTNLTTRHGHSTTFCIAAIHSAARFPCFDKTIFLSAREQDPEFWALLLNYGRPRMPHSVFAPYALFEAERLLGTPIRDVRAITAYLSPPMELEEV